MSDLIALSQHECFRLGVGTGIAIAVTVTAIVGWLLIVAAESDWSSSERDE